MARNNAKGFTLVEVILMIIVIAVLAVVVSIAVNDYQAIKLGNAASRLASDIRYAQQLALTKQVNHGVFFIPPTFYRVFENDDTNDPTRNPSGGGNYEIDLSAGEFQGVTLSTTLPSATVQFTSAGRPLDGADADLAAGANTITLSGSGVADRTVTIEPVTGRVSY
jgi:Tfp pilus assembly protein FimT